MQIKIKRAYEDSSDKDGTRVLVDRLWPRGIKKEDAHLDLWLKEIAPSKELRQWFGHDPDKWGEFKKKFIKELDGNPQVVKQLRQAPTGKVLTLIYAAKDQQHNNAVVIKEYLDSHKQK